MQKTIISLEIEPLRLQDFFKILSKIELGKIKFHVVFLNENNKEK